MPMVEIKNLRKEYKNLVAVKGLSLYGAKLVRPDGIATCQASQT